MTLSNGDQSFQGRVINFSIGGAALHLENDAVEILQGWSELQIEFGGLRTTARPVRTWVGAGNAGAAVSWMVQPAEVERLVAGRDGGEVLYEAPEPSSQQPVLSATLVDVSDEIKRRLANDPQLIHDLTPRQFEELIASILKDLGLDVELTQSTRDGGVDIYAYVRNQVSAFLMLVECKKWAAGHPVGIDVVQRLFGIQHNKKANKSMIITTSYFTVPAQVECRQYYPLMDLKDFEHIKMWLRRYVKSV